MFAAALCLITTPVLAGEAEILDVSGSQIGGSWRFEVTVRHGDTGWDHYADGWSINTPDGRELGFRKLLHPHVDEQPFTRSLGNVVVPAGVTQVIVRVHDSVHGWSSKTYTYALGGS